jgi:hypothetical protein
MASTVVLLGCPPDKPAEGPLVPDAAEGEPCAVGLKVVRTCGPGLACTEMAVAPVDPNQKTMISHQGAGCGGVAQLTCAEGLACLMNEDDPLARDGMGLCQTQSVCTPAAPVATPAD